MKQTAKWLGCGAVLTYSKVDSVVYSIHTYSLCTRRGPALRMPALMASSMPTGHRQAAMGFCAAVLAVLSVCGGVVASNPPAGAMNVFFIAVDGTSASASARCEHPYAYADTGDGPASLPAAQICGLSSAARSRHLKY